MRVSDVMTADVKTVRPQTSATQAFELMRQHAIHHLVVMDGSAVCGVFSDRDAGGRRRVSALANLSVADLMTAPVVVVPPRETVRKAANLMRGRTVGCLPVIEDGRLRGIVTVSDLLELVGGGVGRPAVPDRRHLHYRRPHRKQHRAYGAW